MRNEIYEKIKQSRMRYIAELKKAEIIKRQNENKPEKPQYDNIKDSGTDDNDHLFEIPKFRKQVSFPYVNIDTTGIISLLKKCGRAVRSGTGYLVNKIHTYTLVINRELNSKADKMTDGFYNYSSRFFEDRYEYVEISENQGVKSIAVLPEISVITENEIFDSTVLMFGRIWERLSKTGLVRSIVLFFEMDDEVSINIQSYQSVSEDKTIQAGQTAMPEFVNIFRIGYKKVLKRANRMLGNVIRIFMNTTESCVINFKPLIEKSRIKFQRINFPAINRFVRF